MLAVGYLRPSSAPGILETLPAVQSARIRAQFGQYCRDRGHELAEVFEGAEQFEHLVSRCREGMPRPGVVLIPDSTHFAPDLDTYVDRVLALEAIGIEVRCTSSPLADALENGLKLLRPSSRTTVRASRIRDAIASKAGRGEVLGRTPYGYRVGLDGLLEPVESEAPVVREIFDLYAGGAGVSGGPIGLRRLAANLNARGLRTRGGRLWTTVSLAGVLRNPAYVGIYQRRNVRLAGNHQAIVQRDVFDRAQHAMAERSPRRRARTTNPYLLTGLVTCEACGRTMHGLLRARKWKRRDGGEGSRSYRYYECPSRPASVRHGPGNRESGGAGSVHASWRAEKLERDVLERVRAALGRRASATPAQDDSSRDANPWIELNHSSGSGETGDEVERAVRKKVERAVRSLRAAITRVAAGNGSIAEFTAARAELRRARSEAGSPRASERIRLSEALDAIASDDRDMVRRVLAALVSAIVAGTVGIDVRLRL